MNRDLVRRFDVLEVAQALADIDDPGGWWTLAPEARARYERMALVATELVTEQVRVHDEELDEEEEEELRASFHCLDCGVDTLANGEWYMLRDDVWLEANPVDDGKLCVGCVEERLGRKLGRENFTDAPINSSGWSPRLRARIGRV